MAGHDPSEMAKLWPLPPCALIHSPCSSGKGQSERGVPLSGLPSKNLRTYCMTPKEGFLVHEFSQWRLFWGTRKALHSLCLLRGDAPLNPTIEEPFFCVNTVFPTIFFRSQYRWRVARQTYAYLLYIFTHLPIFSIHSTPRVC